MSRSFAEVVGNDVIEVTKAALEENGFSVKVVDNLDAARNTVLEMIPAGSEVFTGTSVSLDESGLTKELNESGTYVSARSKFAPLAQDPATKVQSRQLGSASEYAVGSVHAVTEDGKVVVASNSGSQLPNYVYGASHVIWVVGAQKIVKDLDEAFERIEKHTLPLEDARAKKAYGVGSVISKLLIYRKDPVERVTIVLVKEAVGY